VELLGKFLIAMPQLSETEFADTVVFIIEQSPKGVTGVVINRPLEMRLNDVLAGLNLKQTFEDAPIFWGGPVKPEQGIIVHPLNFLCGGAAPINSEIGFSISTDVLEEISAGEGPARYLVALGYSGWDAGQLEGEIAFDDWLVADFDPKILFDLPPEERYDAALARLGLDPSIFKASDGSVGHA
jgi:putative transcriptional regulator